MEAGKNVSKLAQKYYYAIWKVFRSWIEACGIQDFMLILCKSSQFPGVPSSQFGHHTLNILEWINFGDAKIHHKYFPSNTKICTWMFSVAAFKEEFQKAWSIFCSRIDEADNAREETCLGASQQRIWDCCHLGSRCFCCAGIALSHTEGAYACLSRGLGVIEDQIQNTE